MRAAGDEGAAADMPDQQTAARKKSFVEQLFGLELGQPALALKEYEMSRQREPNRFRGWYGAATAAERSGDGAKAKTYYAKLAELAKGGGGRPELQQAQRYLASNR